MSKIGEMSRIQINSDFSEYPAGRLKVDGPHSGEAFRDDYLAPLLRDYSKVEVVLDGVEFGLDSSFLEEAFGGLVRYRIASKDELKNRLFIVTNDVPNYKTEIFRYISEAKPGDI